MLDTETGQTFSNYYLNKMIPLYLCHTKYKITFNYDIEQSQSILCLRFKGSSKTILGLKIFLCFV